METILTILAAIIVVVAIAGIGFVLGIVATSLCHISSDIDFDLGDYEWK